MSELAPQPQQPDQPVTATEEQLQEPMQQFNIILACRPCSVKMNFTYRNPDRKPSRCIYCGRRAEEMIESG
ncbi:hypothetical protein Ngar_c17050 [Candidatus Nitrososphaera gargensis Ga9.2]|uniref:Uncharacterized protein n=1 Tax=Nitrososphaera gargensis (strain Ga9.2) TaxID=1237085 RepID=K0II61_NITGG|nr:hypothetical protein [Candidatus Nitrososphaera gargensis]AFU58638.1 hypothetical protein Ngar_c17050 [Candidatus Nitrososphaera gargensis Ga9.2]